APVPLNEAGAAQSAQLGRYLAAHGPYFDTLYASPLLRAMQTAQAIASAVKMPIVPEPRVVEVDLGDWQGLTRAEAEIWDTDRYAAYRAAMPHDPTPNGESWLAVRVRVRAAFDDLSQRHAGQTIALVSHGGTIGQLITSLFGEIKRPTLTNTSITLLARDTPESAWNLARVAWTPHLNGGDSLGETW
ncbi:MAG: histidine phosphatase family protein, partial [Anaerolineae bacterium]|nr:histidine phosphatase family protein [Anaerolineae bacterium]